MQAVEWKTVPVEPTEEMWGGLARQLVFWQRQSRPTGEKLYSDLDRIGMIAPQWLLTEIPDTDHVPPKGTVAACIYKAMLAVAPRRGSCDEEIEVTPEMIEALESEFQDWRAHNDHALSLGAPGDVLDLRLRLNAALAKASTSVFEQPRDL